MNKLPVIDLHCDLLTYLAHNSQNTAFDEQSIGCALPHLQRGGIRIQVMAIYCASEPNSAEKGKLQFNHFRKLFKEYPDEFSPLNNSFDTGSILDSPKPAIGIVCAIENASVLCSEDEPLDEGFRRLDSYLKTGRILYLSLTHHGENRFGGGNKTNVGLKKDGKRLLEYLNGKGIAVDLSHTSDQLAWDIINYIEKKGITIPILASHSNFRSVLDNKRNLPDTIAKEIIDRQGVIGINFLRKYIHPEDPDVLYRHIEHGLKIGAGQALCFGADFFPTKFIEDPDRFPVFFKEHESASKYPNIIDRLRSHSGIDDKLLRKICYKNAVDFLERLWPQ